MYVARPYQTVLSDKAFSIFKEKEKARVMIQLATGGGKTVILSTLVKGLLEVRDDKIIVIVHRHKIVVQIADTLKEFGVSAIIIDADSPPIWMHKKYKETRVFVCMIQTLASRVTKSPSSIPPQSDVGLVICDEAHRMAAKTYKDVFNFYKDAGILGFTATPVRTDAGKLMDTATDGILIGPTVKMLQSIGALVNFQPYKVHAIPYKDLKAMIQESKSQKALDRNMSGFIAEYDVLPKAYKFWKKFCTSKPTIIFASDRLQGNECHKFFQSKGVNAAYIDGTTDEAGRCKVDQGLEDGSIDVLINVMLATEGYDVPKLEACLILRSCYSLSMVLQMYGRVLRPYTNKETGYKKSHAIIADFGGNIERFGLPDKEHPWEDYFNGTIKPTSYFNDAVDANTIDIDLSGDNETQRNTGKLLSSMVKSLSNQVSDERLRKIIDKHSSGEISLSKLAQELMQLRSEIPEARIALNYVKHNNSFESVIESNRKVTDKAKVLIDKAIKTYSQERKLDFISYFTSELHGIPTIFDILYAAKKLKLTKEEALSFCSDIGFEQDFISEVVSPYTQLDL